MSKPGEIVTDDAPIKLDVHPLEVWKDDVKLRDWEGDTFTLICCDCSLVHHVGVMRDTHTGRILVGMSSDSRRTAQYRRNKRGNLHNGNGKWRLIRNG